MKSVRICFVLLALSLICVGSIKEIRADELLIAEGEFLRQDTNDFVKDDLGVLDGAQPDGNVYISETPPFWSYCGIDILPNSCRENLEEYAKWKHFTEMHCHAWPSPMEKALCEEARYNLSKLEDPFQSEECGPYIRACWLKASNEAPYENREELIQGVLGPLAVNRHGRFCPLSENELSEIASNCFAKRHGFYPDPALILKDPYTYIHINLSSCLKDGVSNKIGTLDPADYVGIVPLLVPETGFHCKHMSICMAKVLDLAGIPNGLEHSPFHVSNTVYHSNACVQHLDCLNDIDYLDQNGNVISVCNAR